MRTAAGSSGAGGRWRTLQVEGVASRRMATCRGTRRHPSRPPRWPERLSTSPAGGCCRSCARRGFCAREDEVGRTVQYYYSTANLHGPTSVSSVRPTAQSGREVHTCPHPTNKPKDPQGLTVQSSDWRPGGRAAPEGFKGRVDCLHGARMLGDQGRVRARVVLGSSNLALLKWFSWSQSVFPGKMGCEGHFSSWTCEGSPFARTIRPRSARSYFSSQKRMSPGRMPRSQCTKTRP